MKTCTVCLVEKPLDDYQNDKRRSDGKKSTCRPCKLERERRWRREHPEAARLHRRRIHLKKNYGITLAEFEAMLAAQEGKCAIGQCGRDARVVDHCHRSGKVRALLCSGCNTSIGHLREDPALIRSVAEWVELHC